MHSNRHLWFRLEAKVMAAVLAVLVALPALTLWIVDSQVTRQIKLDAATAAATAQESFEQMLNVRAEELALRFRNLETNPGFLRVVRLHDAATMRDALREDVLGQFRDTDLAVFVTRQGEVWGARRETVPVTPDTLAAAAEKMIATAAQGQEEKGFVAIRHGVYRVVAVPVQPPEGIAGVLVFANHITREALQLVKPPLAEIVVISGDELVASTFGETAVPDPGLTTLLTTLSRTEHDDFDLCTVAGERYQPEAGRLAPGVRYVVLASSERRLQMLERTKLKILVTSAVAIVLCAAVVWFFVRRITRPLGELRDAAEAVGRGDFSRRIARVSHDECGDLAMAFNGMTANLQSSRAELERAMQQVKATQQQLIQSEKLSAVGQFVAGVAHELNNPLTSVVGYSELVQSMPAEPKIHGFLDKIAKSAHRCHKIVQSLLSFARQHPPERRIVDLPAIMEEVLEIMAYDLRTSNTAIVREFAAGVPQVMGDQHQLQQVFVNILSNARQAMEPVQREGRIIIRIAAVADRVTIEFEDNGPGIRAEHLARIFDPFFTTKPVGKGTGLGLSLCYGIIKEHGGTITARSAPGAGATFAIELPVTADAAPKPSAGTAAAGAAPAVAGVGKAVLVIDDEPWILELAAESLRGEGHEVTTAQSGEQALELIGRRRFDVIVTDWKMPGMNGIRLYEQLQATNPAAAARVLFMTGDVVSDRFQEFLRERRLTCLSKPFATREFSAAVAKVGA